jgi:hypothetical protein
MPIDPFASVFKAIAWADELAGNPKLKRADIARREGMSRARVTQLLRFAAHGRGFWEDLRASGNPFSLRDLLGMVQRRKDGHQDSLEAVSTPLMREQCDSSQR